MRFKSLRQRNSLQGCRHLPDLSVHRHSQQIFFARRRFYHARSLRRLCRLFRRFRRLRRFLLRINHIARLCSVFRRHDNTCRIVPRIHTGAGDLIRCLAVHRLNGNHQSLHIAPYRHMILIYVR